jgi:hypothetical protein
VLRGASVTCFSARITPIRPSLRHSSVTTAAIGVAV